MQRKASKVKPGQQQQQQQQPPQPQLKKKKKLKQREELQEEPLAESPAGHSDFVQHPPVPAGVAVRMLEHLWLMFPVSV